MEDPEVKQDAIERLATAIEAEVAARNAERAEQERQSRRLVRAIGFMYVLLFYSATIESIANPTDWTRVKGDIPLIALVASIGIPAIAAILQGIRVGTLRMGLVSGPTLVVAILGIPILIAKHADAPALLIGAIFTWLSARILILSAFEEPSIATLAARVASAIRGRWYAIAIARTLDWTLPIALVPLIVYGAVRSWSYSADATVGVTAVVMSLELRRAFKNRRSGLG